LVQGERRLVPHRKPSAVGQEGQRRLLCREPERRGHVKRLCRGDQHRASSRLDYHCAQIAILGPGDSSRRMLEDPSIR